MLKRFIYALAHSFEHPLDFSYKNIVIVHRQAFDIATNTRYRTRKAQNDAYSVVLTSSYSASNFRYFKPIL